MVEVAACTGGSVVAAHQDGLIVVALRDVAHAHIEGRCEYGREFLAAEVQRVRHLVGLHRVVVDDGGDVVVAAVVPPVFHLIVEV